MWYSQYALVDEGRFRRTTPILNVLYAGIQLIEKVEQARASSIMR